MLGNYDASIEDLIGRILEVTQSPESTGFYRKAITLLGTDTVEMELAEVRYRARTNRLDSPARYLSALLKTRLDDLNGLVVSRPNELQSSYFSPSQLSLFMELKPGLAVDDSGTEKAMPIPYSKSGIPWATFIGPGFFTLSTNKAKSDRVIARFRTMDGEIALVPVIRGRIFPGDDERGILTADHGRILGALECAWVQEGCRYTEFGNGMMVCYCDVPVRKLARLLGWRAFGGTELRCLKRKVMDLKTMPYYLDLDAVAEFKAKGIKGYGFTLVGDITLLEKRQNGIVETILKIRFSDTFSRQLLARRTVSRPRGLLTHRSELAFLLRLYLEPFLISRKGGTYDISLSKLVENLNLPSAKWHRHKSTRREQLQKAVSELNGEKTIDGRTISVRIERRENDDDFILTAQLVRGLPLASQ